jgi:hypothetical protein
MDYRSIGLFISLVGLAISGAFLIRWIYGSGNDMVGLASICGTIASLASMLMFGTLEHVESLGDVLAVAAGATGKATGTAAGALVVAFAGEIAKTDGMQLVVQKAVEIATNGTLVAVGVGAASIVAVSGGAAAVASGAGLGGAIAAAITAATASPFALICIIGVVLLGSFSSAGSIAESVGADMYTPSPGESINWGEAEGGKRRKRRSRR